MKADVWREGFKDKDNYLTAEGWTLGTECQYVYVEADGFCIFHCAPTIEEAREKATKWLEGLDS